MNVMKKNIETYILAKDGNRPHLMANAFETNAELSMLVKTEDIAFPSAVFGRDAIESVLVRQFTTQYENVYTFCLTDAPSETGIFVCNWLVCMTEKTTGALRLGFGEYEWTGDAGLISHLKITIEEMLVLESDLAAPILAWARTRPYPWCTLGELIQDLPPIDALRRVTLMLAENRRS